ncbi:MAG: histidine phosphatase family protein [Verrucomicrobia bacterium]|nr:histidine phosphatase family protein [Verrucomicrobiota bacterium]
MTTFVLVRHGENDLISSRVAGRQPGVHLNEAGREQARKVAERLAGLPIDAIYAGPLERACETAQPLCARTNLPLQIADEFNEIQFADWTNCAFADLRRDREFQVWNSFRSFSAPPDGEMMIEVQARVVRKLRDISRQHHFAAIFSHGDVIRATMAFVLGVPLDLFQRIKIDSASISAFELGDDWLRVLAVNANCDTAQLLHTS